MSSTSTNSEPSSSTSRPSFNQTVTSSTQNFGAPGSGNRVLKIVTSSSVNSGLSPFGQNAASTIRDHHEREKKEILELNNRLAEYVEKVRFLEAQNEKLAADLKLLQGS
uniref:IF rod domain-containing protein n=1 Tax=Caenorhabditis tropicalis TaxID=1561998 RepID=A0A1I7TZI4_9PELO